MNDLSEIIKKRSPPGVLIFDLRERLLYSNQQAVEMLALRQKTAGGGILVPEPVYSLCRALKEIKGETNSDLCCSILDSVDCPPASLRAFLITEQSAEGLPPHIMVLMEKIVERHEINIDKARREFLLSKREAEVVKLVCQGVTNREISGALFISEYTVKDHLKSIMKKMGAGSRNEIFALLK